MRYFALFLHTLFTSTLKDVYSYFQSKHAVQETVYEASYIVPSTQYDRIEGPKFRRRNVQSLASGTEKVREADFQHKHSSKHRSTQEQVALPFPAGRNTYQIMSARPSKLPTVASSVLVESSTSSNRLPA